MVPYLRFDAGARILGRVNAPIILRHALPVDDREDFGDWKDLPVVFREVILSGPVGKQPQAFQFPAWRRRPGESYLAFWVLSALAECK